MDKRRASSSGKETWGEPCQSVSSTVMEVNRIRREPRRTSLQPVLSEVPNPPHTQRRRLPKMRTPRHSEVAMRKVHAGRTRVNSLPILLRGDASTIQVVQYVRPLWCHEGVVLGRPSLRRLRRKTGPQTSQARCFSWPTREHVKRSAVEQCDGRSARPRTNHDASTGPDRSRRVPRGDSQRLTFRSAVGQAHAEEGA
jgi:hypothetical protein